MYWGKAGYVSCSSTVSDWPIGIGSRLIGAVSFLGVSRAFSHVSPIDILFVRLLVDSSSYPRVSGVVEWAIAIEILPA